MRLVLHDTEGLLNHDAFTCTNLDQGLICLVLHDTEGLLAEHQIRIKIGSQSVHIRTYVVGPNRYDFFLPDLTIEATDEAAIIKAILSLRPIITQAAVLSAYRDINILNRIDEMNEDLLGGKDMTKPGYENRVAFLTEQLKRVQEYQSLFGANLNDLTTAIEALQTSLQIARLNQMSV